MSQVVSASADAADAAVRRSGLLAIGGLSVIVFLASAVGSLSRGGVRGALGGVVTGALMAALFVLVGRWALRYALKPKPAPTLLEASSDLDRLLGPTLAELETLRADVVVKVNTRMAVMLPLGLTGGVLFWAFNQLGRRPMGPVELFVCCLVGGVAGWWLASGKLNAEYVRLYKSRVLPQLCSRFGKLDWRPARTPDLAQLKKEHVLPGYDRVDADDELYGTYRGLDLSLVELKLHAGSGKEERKVFDGLLTRVELPRSLAGVTAIVGDHGLWGNLADRMGRNGRQCVRLEDPRFEKAFEVYASDQIAARALLTPAFMERLMTLGQRAGFSTPTALAVDNRLTIALPKSGSRDLFEPPSYSEPAKSQAALTQLSEDVAAVLRAADAVIDLDQAARDTAAMAAPATGA